MKPKDYEDKGCRLGGNFEGCPFPKTLMLSTRRLVVRLLAKYVNAFEFTDGV